ncbi:MAG: SGNH/GDSL hydrolase family protein [Lachnospiraceae bacterium]|nr:SGNH/GDSL hydrolase family protein [Lachnospiraceae bacterium]MCM1257629.1 SGNH/GDSL hydrolase family protein [Roseburia sp.]
MQFQIKEESGVSNRGNQFRLKKVINRAAAGEKLTIAFLGGSITQGSLASRIDLCYASRVSNWWRETYPQGDFTFINGGIGGTTSHFGTARVAEDVLSHRPDLVFVEFSVNDDPTPFFQETYEGLLRKILLFDTSPAVVLIHNVRYDTGGNAQTIHAALGRYYGLPGVSMQNTIFPAVVSGNLPVRDITEDDLHPNDLGHELVAGVVTSFLESVDRDRETKEPSYAVPEKPMTQNRYENCTRYNNKNLSVSVSDFVRDEEPQQGITDIFKNGFYSAKQDALLKCRVAGSELAIQYRKSVRHPAPLAELVIDDDREHKILLDGNFDEDWGDCLFLQPVLIHGESKTHTLEIRIVAAEDEQIPFYLNAVIAADAAGR